MRDYGAESSVSVQGGPAGPEPGGLSPNVPLVVDLDGTLIKSDTLHESIIALARKTPSALLRLPFWLPAGRAAVKQRIEDRLGLDPALLPYDPRVIDAVEAARNAGCRTVLATAADQRIADRVSDHLGLFDEVLATRGAVNLGGARKAEALVDRYGAGGFDYIGNSAADLPVWAQARRALAANAPSAVVRRLARTHPAPVVLSRRRAPWLPLLRAMRPYQWVKNLLLFVPLVASQTFAAAVWARVLVAFCCFSAMASAVYLVNDLLDLEHDRRHPRKKNRPFASGEANILHGMLAAATLALGSILVAYSVSPAFLGLLLLYVAVTTAYSARLKQTPLVDVMLLAGLYTLRVLAGAAACQIVPSFWLLGFSMLLFTSLAFAKRYAEVSDASRRGTRTLSGRGYQLIDEPVLATFGVSSGYAAVVVMALYINATAETGVYATPVLLWAVCPLLLYWISRMWLAAQRGFLTDDPIVFALRDRVSRVVILACSLVVLAASQKPSRLLAAFHS